MREADAIQVLGRGTNVDFTIDDSVPFEIAERGLRDYLEVCRGLYSSGTVSVNVGRRILAPDQLSAIKRILDSETGLTVSRYWCAPETLQQACCPPSAGGPGMSRNFSAYADGPGPDELRSGAEPNGSDGHGSNGKGEGHQLAFPFADLQPPAQVAGLPYQQFGPEPPVEAGEYAAAAGNGHPAQLIRQMRDEISGPDSESPSPSSKEPPFAEDGSRYEPGGDEHEEGGINEAGAGGDGLGTVDGGPPGIRPELGAEKGELAGTGPVSDTGETIETSDRDTSPLQQADEGDGYGPDLGGPEHEAEENRQHHGQEGRRGNPALIIKNTCRSGEVIRYPGDVVVFGDVNPGAVIIADGDIIVLGALRGMAQAGADNDPKATILALNLESQRLQIGQHVGEAPRAERRARSGNRAAAPRIAYLKRGSLFVAPFARRREEYQGGVLYEG